MKKDTVALIFGDNKYSFEIVNSVKKDYTVKIYTKKNEEIQKNFKDMDLYSFDLSDEWQNLENDIDVKNSIAFCVMKNEAENVFLTISLRAYFKELLIVAIATNKESIHKLKMAGANKVIPIEETTAEIISDMLHKPLSSRVLHDILYTEGSLKIAQIEVQNEEIFNDKYISDIDWSRFEGIIVLSIMHKDLSTDFIYSSKAKRSKLKNGDMLIIVGYEADIEIFEKQVGGRVYVNWSDWSR